MSALEDSLNAAPAPVAPNSLQSVANQIAGQPLPSTMPNPSAGLIEIDAPKLDPSQSINKDSYARRTFRDPNAVYDAYDELQKKFTTDLGEVKSTLGKVTDTFGSLPELLAARLTESLKSVFPLQPVTPEPPKPASTPSGAANGVANGEQFGSLKFSADDVLDGTFADKLNALTQAVRGSSTPQINKDELIAAISAQMEQTVNQKLAERDEQRMQHQVQQEMSNLVKQGFDENLVKTAVVLGAQAGKNSVGDAWQDFQTKYPQFFQKEKANSIVAEMAGQRINVPVDLNGSQSRVTTVDEFQRNFAEALRTPTVSDALGI